MAINAETRALIQTWENSLQAVLSGTYSLSPEKIHQLHSIKYLLEGFQGGSIGEPIAGASIIVATPQAGDTVAGSFDTINPTTGLTEQIQYPAIGETMLVADPMAWNGIPAEAQSVHIIARLPQDVITLNTQEAVDLKNLAAFACMDGGTPDPTYDGGMRYVPIGGLYSKAWISREMALALRAIARWQPTAGQTQPYPNYRLIGEFVFFREPIAFPVFEPSLIEPVIVGGTGSDSSGETEATTPIAPIPMTFQAGQTESDWATLPNADLNFAGLEIPANVGADSLTFRLREIPAVDEGLPLLDTTVSIPVSGGYLGRDDMNRLLGLSYCLGGLHQIKGVLNVAPTEVKEFNWLLSGGVAANPDPASMTTLSFPVDEVESAWVELPNAPNSAKFMGLKIPANSGAASMTFLIRRQGMTGSGQPLLNTIISIPATGGYTGEDGVRSLIGLSPCLGGFHELKGIVDTANSTTREFTLFSP